MQVGDGKVLVEFVLTVHVHDLADDTHCATHVLGRLRRTLHRHADDDVGTHLTGEVCRIVVLQTTVHQHLVAESDGREGGWDGHRGAHGLRQASAVEVHLIVGDDVRCRTGKGDGQVACEVERIGVSHAELGEQFGQVLTPDDTAGVHVLLADGDARREEVGVLLLPVGKALVAQVLLVGDHVAPVLHPHHRVERVGVVADGVQTTDDAAHRRAGDDIHGDARLLQHLQHTDMCHTLRAAAAQHDADLLPGVTHSRAVFLLYDSRAVTHLSFHHAAHHRSHQYHYNLFHPLNPLNPLLFFTFLPFYFFTFSPFHLYLWYFLLNSSGVMPACSLKYLPKNDALGKFRSLAISCIVMSE